MYSAILVVHVILGIIALSSGAFAIFSKKGGKLHTKSGTIYYLAMWGIAITAIVMTVMKPNPFLLSIAVFSLYMTYSGKKAITYWRLKEAYTPTLKDKIPFCIGLATSLFMIGYPIFFMLRDHYFFVPVLLIFGLVLLFFCARDFAFFSKKENFFPRNKQWLLHHIGKMGGAYIATCTAFLVNNVHMEPGWVVWMFPTAVGVPIIFIAAGKWKKKLK